MRRTWPLLVALVLAACGEEQPAGVTPLPPSTSARRAPIAEAPSPTIVAPHLRRTNASSTSTVDLRPPSGGSGGEDQTPRPAPVPSAREVEEFRRRLDRELADRVDPDEDPCDQFLEVMRSTAAAADQPGREPELPSRAELRRRCGRFSETFQQCMSPRYFQQHLDECNAEIARLAERGERRRAAAQRQWEAIERGEQVADDEADEGG